MPPLPPGPYGHPLLASSRRASAPPPARPLSAVSRGPRAWASALTLAATHHARLPRVRFLKTPCRKRSPSRGSGAAGRPRREPGGQGGSYKRRYKLAGMDSERPSTPIVLRRAQARARNKQQPHRPATPLAHSRPRPSPIPGPAPTPTLARRRPGRRPAPRPSRPTAPSPPVPATLGRPGSRALAPQASWRSLGRGPTLIPEGLPDPLAFPGPRPSFRGRCCGPELRLLGLLTQQYCN